MSTLVGCTKSGAGTPTLGPTCAGWGSGGEVFYGLSRFSPSAHKPCLGSLIHKGILHPEGLLPCHSPDIDGYALLYRMPGRWAVRRLTFEEKLRLYQMPLNMDPLLAVWKYCKRLPFEDTPSPEVYTLVFHQLWGDCVGGLNGSKEMRNDVVDLGCAAVSTARARLDGTI